jgi:hypothetical protein
MGTMNQTYSYTTPPFLISNKQYIRDSIIGIGT